MANATKGAAASVTGYPEGMVFKEQLDVSFVQDYYPMTMVGYGPNGYLVYCDDTQDVQFLGLVGDSVTVSVLTGDVQGVRKLNVKRERLFTMAITGATVGDVGKPVYAAFNNQVQYGTGSFGNLCGYVAEFRSATEVLVAYPTWADLRGGRGKYIGARTVTTTTTLPTASLNKRIYVGSGTFTITLPPVANTQSGDRYAFKKTAGANTATLQGNGAETIDGSNTLATMTASNKFVEIESDATQWWVLNSN